MIQKVTLCARADPAIEQKKTELLKSGVFQLAKYRNVHIDFWQDGFVLDLTPEEKYFYIYLMTNSKTTQCGIYELPKRIIETETGYNRETVEKLLERFIEYGKIQYNKSSREVILLNWVKYNSINSPKVKTLIKKELGAVKYQPFIELYEKSAIQYGYSMDTVSIDFGEERELRTKKEKEKENKEREEIPYVEIIQYLNQTAITNYRHSTKKTKDCIQARWNEGFTLDDFKKVIDIKCKEWIHDPKMNKFLRPETLFSNKFEGYLNQKGAPNGSHNSSSEEEYGIPL